MWRLVLVLAIGCGNGKSPGGGDATTEQVCLAQFQAVIDKSCTSPSQCVLVDHNDCCGTVRMAVKAGTESAFLAAETQLHMCFDCGARGCDHADQAEDGRFPQQGQSIVAQCIALRCTSAVQ